jgi:serine/threonine protein kinase
VKEAEILEKLKHKNIISFKKAIYTNTRILLVMELALGGTLQQLINKRRQSQGVF